MNASFRRTVSRNYSGRNDGNDEIDAALDDLGNFSYLDGIPFELDRGIQSALETARIHMNKAEALLATPLPASLNQSAENDSLLEDIGRVERQVLEQLKQIEHERAERKRKKDAMIKEYLEKKEKERINAEKELEEKELQSSNENNPDNQDDENGDKSGEAENENQSMALDESAADVENSNDTSLNHQKEATAQLTLKDKINDNLTTNEVSAVVSQPDNQNSAQSNKPNLTESASSVPVATYLEPSRSNATQLAHGSQSKPNTAHGLINFSEFESESDPFERAELQTLNDMQELASVFPQSSSMNTNVSSGVSSASGSSLGIGHHQYTKSKTPMMMSTAGNTAPVTNQVSNNNFQYSQFSNPMVRLPQTNHPGQFNPFLQTSQGSNMPHHHPSGSFYNQGMNVPTTMIPSTNSNQPYPPNPMFHQNIATPYIPPYQPQTASDTINHPNQSETQPAETLKTSKSVGDLMTEIQKETEAMMLATDKDNVKRHSNEAAIKKSRAFSQTPPPSKTTSTGNDTKGRIKPHQNVSQRQQNALDEWIPWPDPDGLPSATQKNEPSQNSRPTINPLEGLSNESSEKCKQLHDMGFPLERLGKACRAIGNDEQKLINYCLFVDKVLEDSSISHRKFGPNGSDVVEDVVLIHSSDETKIKKHLEAFGRLIEFGFEPPSKIHTALTECDLDYEKALEQMLK